MSPRETPRQAKVRRIALRFVSHPGAQEGPAIFNGWLVRFGLEVWQAARRQTIREMAMTKRARGRLAERARKAGL